MDVEMTQKLHGKLQVNFKNLIWHRYCMFDVLEYDNQ